MTARLLTNKRERAPILICDGFEVRRAVVPHKVDVLLYSEVVELLVEQVVVMYVEDGAIEAAHKLKDLCLVCYV